MTYYLDNLERNLTEEENFFLKSIYEPKVVTIPPEDACRSMCVSPDGEIRIYGADNKKYHADVGCRVYIASKDGGLSWKKHLVPENAIGAASFNPETGRYISTHPNEYRPDLNEYINKEGTWAIISNEGFDSSNFRLVKLSDKFVHILKPPMLIDDNKRWLIFGEYFLSDFSDKFAIVFYSDDDGESWTEVLLDKSVPKHIPEYPHKHPRWQQFTSEPTIAELSTGELVMIVRTSQDYHYMYRSTDRGETWSDPVPSPFHGTITMPILHKLRDGRIVFFWCNTHPMPECDVTNIFPPIGEWDQIGISEDVFTNRDANHLAITDDDMKTWKGFREVFLNTIRNNADFRSIGGLDSIDKSIHQGQILELPFNKILIHFGQNVATRKVMILDLDWLYEKNRSENFRFGLENVSTQMYVKSILGGFRGHSGHCAYNRINGAKLMIDPSGNGKEVIQLCRIEDDALVYKKQGVVWNFPASQKGVVKMELSVLGCGVRVCLTDRWFNPVDEYVSDEAQFVYDLNEKCDFEIIKIEYDTEKMIADIIIGDKKETVSLKNYSPHGLSYLHIQTLAETEDQNGTLIRWFEKTEN